MDSTEKTEIVTFIAAILLMMLFGYAATSKLAAYQTTVFQLSMTLPPFLKPFNSVIAWLVPLIEFVIVGLLVFEKSRKTGLYLSFLLLLVFELFIAGMLLSGSALPCTCGGVISRLSWKGHLAFNAFFMLVAAAPFIYRGFSNKYRNKEYSPPNVGVDT